MRPARPTPGPPPRTTATTPRLRTARAASSPRRPMGSAVVVHVLDTGDALRRGGRLQVLRVTGYGAVERHVPVQVLDGDAGGVHQRVEGQLCLDRVADVLRLAHVRDPFRDRWDGRPAARQSVHPAPVMPVKAMVAW